MNKPLDSRQLSAAADRRTSAGSANTPRRSAPTSAVAQSLRHRDQAAVHAARLDAASATTPTSAIPGQPPYTRGIYADDAPRPHLDAAPADRPRHAARLQRAAARHPRAGRHRGVADPVQLGVPRLRHGRGRTPELLGTCGVVVNTVDAHGRAASPASISRATSCAMNDPSPFTLLAFMLATAKRRGVAWNAISGTSNQSDYLSPLRRQPHVLPHRAAGRAARSSSTTSSSAAEHVPNWNPMSVVGQHMQQAGATPAEAMAFTLALRDPVRRGLHRARHGPGRVPAALHVLLRHLASASSRRSPSSAPAGASGRGSRASASARRTRAPGASSSTRQTSGVDLTRQQPLNNIARVTVQAMAGIFGGLQSLHTDAYDEALSCPTEFGARIAVATQNILREEAHLTDVIDPLGGSYYVEALTDEMEAKILRDHGRGRRRRRHVRGGRAGLVQKMIGESARRFQERIESRRADRRRRQRLPGRRGRERAPGAAEARPGADAGAHRAFRAYKAARSQAAVRQALDASRARGQRPGQQRLRRAWSTAAEAGCTHGEICAHAAARTRLRPAAGRRLTRAYRGDRRAASLRRPARSLAGDRARDRAR